MKSLDVLGSQFNMSYGTLTNKFQTTLGAFLSIGLGIISCILFVIIISQYFDTTDPTVTTSTEFNSGISKFNMYREELIMPVALMVGGKLLFGDQIRRFATLKAQVNE